MIDPIWRPPILETTRLRLRPFDAADAPALFAIASNPNVTRFTFWDSHRAVDDSRAFINDFARSCYLEKLPDPYAIELVRTGDLLGSAGCFWASRPNRCMELGYWIAEPFWGHGFATEAARALVGHVFATYPVERVEAHFIDGNPASGRVLEKAGMQYEGIRRHALLHRGQFRDVFCYAVLRDEWANTPAAGG
jgi:[ribosomal protein S5]-alanine N-acetyltransferase